MCFNILCNTMRENAQPATPTIADRQVPASSSHRTQAPVPSSFSSSAGETPERAAIAATKAALFEDLGDDAALADWSRATLPNDVTSPHAAEAFLVFKIAGNGEPVLLESTRTLDAAVAWVVSLRELFPGEYLILSEATGKRIVFTRQSVINDGAIKASW